VAKNKTGKTSKMKNNSTNQIELSAFEQELVDTMKKVREYKLASEANIVSIIYSLPDTIHNYELKLEDFSNNIWKVYFAVAKDLLVNEKKHVLDEITVGLYLDKHPKLKSKYNEYGGYETIENAKSYIKEENMSGYVRELKKWNVVIELLKMKFPVQGKLSKFADMSAEEIYSEYEAKLNHLFLNVDGEVKSYNLCENLNELIDELNQGKNVGLPLCDSPLLNQLISGCNLGHINMLGAGSGVGKTTTAIRWLLPSIIEHDEKMCIIINEEDQTKIQKEMLIWVANNIFKQELKKHVLRNGNFDEDTMVLLRKCAEWLEEKKERKNITIIPLERYTTKIAIKIIKKYASMGCKFFLLDTLKSSSDSRTENVWLEMQRDMVELYDTVKPSAKNVSLWVNYQLTKASIKQRYLTNEAIGNAKSIVDVSSVNIMIRSPFDDELEGGKHEITGYRFEGKNKKSKIPFKLDKNKHYVIIFITKNRFGETQPYQIIAEHNLSTNIYKELGICYIIQDW